MGANATDPLPDRPLVAGPVFSIPRHANTVLRMAQERLRDDAIRAASFGLSAAGELNSGTARRFREFKVERVFRDCKVDEDSNLGVSRHDRNRHRFRDCNLAIAVPHTQSFGITYS